MGWALAIVVDGSYGEASFGNTTVTDPASADDVVILAESPEILMLALEALNVERSSCNQFS